MGSMKYKNLFFVLASGFLLNAEHEQLFIHILRYVCSSSSGGDGGGGSSTSTSSSSSNGTDNAMAVWCQTFI
ncbi:hypothetical protein T4B_4226 [Trichinella pseudospiralis]|uniref:Uncharacterized protein n=1 Tax=Trichinella pseudospiralis TaxID=6337 RepID=A0A0V1IK80_TRIPS|nr:hypothetical protein T4B_4226 [Trichinella pseudospiralis]